MQEEGEELQTLRRMLHDDKKKKKLRLKMIVTRWAATYIDCFFAVVVSCVFTWIVTPCMQTITQWAEAGGYVVGGRRGGKRLQGGARGERGKGKGKGSCRRQCPKVRCGFQYAASFSFFLAEVKNNEKCRAPRGMSDQETGLPGVRPMKFLKKGVKMPKPKAIRMKAGEYSHQVWPTLV